MWLHQFVFYASLRSRLDRFAPKTRRWKLLVKINLGKSALPYEFGEVSRIGFGDLVGANPVSWNQLGFQNAQ